MAKMKIEKGFLLLPEGRYTFKVVECNDEYEKYDTVSYTLQASNGQKVFKNFNFVNADGEVNTISIYYWSKFARACLNNIDADDEPEIEFNELVNCFVSVEVKHVKYTAKSGKYAGEERTKVETIDKTFEPATGFENAQDTSEDDSNEDLEDELDDLDDLDNDFNEDDLNF